MRVSVAERNGQVVGCQRVGGFLPYIMRKVLSLQVKNGIFAAFITVPERGFIA